jgi:apolipoprotein N-acyltransferase
VAQQGQGWKYVARPPVLAVMTGCLLVLSAPPVDLWPLGLVALVPLHLAIRESSVLEAALLGWLAGFVAHLGTQLWWVGFLERFTTLSLATRVLAAGAVFAFEALVFALWTGGARLVVERYAVSWLVASPLALVVSEWALPSLLPWHVGIVLWKAWPLIQVAELGGVWAVSALVVATNVLLAEAGVTLYRGARLPRSAFIAAGLLASVVVLGLGRAYQVEAAEEAAPKLRAGIVQPNFGALPSGERARHGRQLLRKLARADRQLTDEGARLIVWSETLWPYLFDRSLTREFQGNHPWSLGRRGPSSLLMGAATHPFGTELVYNSALLFLASGELAGRYDKQRPVPFSEYVPFGELYPPFAAAG